MPIYDLTLPISFHCAHCKKNHQLLAGEAEKQTPVGFLPQSLSFRCPSCQTVLKAKIGQGHWVKDMSGRKSVYVLDQAEFA